MNRFNNNLTAWIVLGIGAVGAILFTIGEMCGYPAASANGVLILVSVIWVALAIPLVIMERGLLVGVLPAMVAVFAIWMPVAFREAGQPEFVILLPLPLVAAFLLIWTPLGWVLFHLKRRCRMRLTLGGLTETIAMIWLLLPWLMATIALPALLGENDELVASVTSIGVGLIWSNLISQPFARFVRSII
ncbi:MAG: hypothetical protein OXE87_16745 [Chloroflexi bacterium]|nr:hypothetical protein [Chloroflexota bacterium]